ncbi:Tfp pilus assembly protein FimT/FimU [Paenalcaligenes hominis]|uniref:pilus assembly FimT family protein n=1 Tax=Paenalcaligenes hominis TaxID=643674 RepID=UPI0035254CCC
MKTIQLSQPIFVSSQCKNQRQAGLSLIEISVVSAIILLIAIVSIPAINGFIVESRVPKVGEGIARFVMNHSVNTPLYETQPYDGVDNELFAQQLESAGVFNIIGSGAGVQILHGLGKDGTVEITGGQELKITLNKVSHAACPGLSSVLQRIANTISVGAEVVKSESKIYNATHAQKQCERGDSNTFEFVIG